MIKSVIERFDLNITSFFFLNSDQTVKISVYEFQIKSNWNLYLDAF